MKIHFSQATKNQDGTFSTEIIINREGDDKPRVGAASIRFPIQPGVEILDIKKLFSHKTGAFLFSILPKRDEVRIIFFSLESFVGENFCRINFATDIEGTLFTEFNKGTAITNEFSTPFALDLMPSQCRLKRVMDLVPDDDQEEDAEKEPWELLAELRDEG